MWATSHPIPLIPDGLTGNLQTRDRPALPLLPRNTSDEDSSWGFSSALLRFLEIVSAGKKDKGQRKMVHEFSKHPGVALPGFSEGQERAPGILCSFCERVRGWPYTHVLLVCSTPSS